jgi:hypothetical protein
MKSIMLLNLILFIPTVGLFDDGWEVKKEQDGVKVLARNVEGAEINEFRAIMEMKTTVNKLVALYLDVDKGTEWEPNCTYAKLVQKISDTELYIYRKINNPWPFKDMDYIIRINLTQNTESGEALIEFEDVKSVVPRYECCTRMKMMKGFWRFTPSEDGHVVVTYQYHFQHGFRLPASLINASFPSAAIATLIKMNECVQKIE